MNKENPHKKEPVKKKKPTDVPEPVLTREEFEKTLKKVARKIKPSSPGKAGR